MNPPVSWAGEDTHEFLVSPRAREHTHGAMLGITRRARWIAMLPILAPSAAAAADDAAIWALIDALKPTAEAIAIDGNPADWGAIPAFPDPSGDVGDASRDITSVRIAPTANALAVLIQTAGTPS